MLAFSGFDLPKKFFTSSDGDLLSEQSRPVRIRMAMAELGTTYIKLGQMLSTRGDLVGWETADELVRLQTDVRPDPPEVAMATVAAELGRPVEEVFTSFETETHGLGLHRPGPLRHAARWHRGGGEGEHPDIESRIRADLEILMLLARPGGALERAEALPAGRGGFGVSAQPAA